MSVHALILGALFKDPEERTSSKGSPFVSATLKVKDGNAMAFWKVLAFQKDAQEELLRLREGDRISVQGGFRAEPFVKNGETRIGFTIFADNVLPLRGRPREKLRKKSPSAPAPAADDYYGNQGSWERLP